MLAVLSELNCLEALNMRNIYPDLYSDDIQTFKDSVSMSTGYDILMITTADAKFNKKKTKDFITSIKDILATETSIKSFTIISDYKLPYLEEYYLLRNTLDNLTKCSHWKELGLSNILEQFQGPKKETKILKYEDKPLEPTKRASSEDELIPLIKVFKFTHS